MWYGRHVILICIWHRYELNFGKQSADEENTAALNALQIHNLLQIIALEGNTLQIGFLDSGIGGLTVLNEALKMLPNEDYLYYADLLHVPYGNKPKEAVREYIFEAADFFARKNVKALVVACNTATSVAVRDLRSMYDFPVIGMEPAVKPAIEKSEKQGRRVLVLATELTLREEKFRNLVDKIDTENIVDAMPFPELVHFAERLEFREEVVKPVLWDKLSGFEPDRYGAIVLGCTHFVYFRDMIKGLFPQEVEIIDGGYGTVRHLKKVLEERQCLGNSGGNVSFYNSGTEVVDVQELDRYRQLLDRLKEIS